MSRRHQLVKSSTRLRTLKNDLSRIIHSSQSHSDRTPLQLLIIASYLNRLKFIETVNNHVCWDKTQCKFSPGVLAQLLVLLPFIPSFSKIPLSRIHERYSGMDLELLVGEPIDPSELNDDQFARLLDRIYDADCSRLLLKVALLVRLIFNLPENVVLHSDTTSHVLFGDYVVNVGVKIPNSGVIYSPVHLKLSQNYPISLCESLIN